jgi:hypothetical protein
MNHIFTPGSDWLLSVMLNGRHNSRFEKGKSKLFPIYDMKAYRGLKKWRHSFLTSAIHGGTWPHVPAALTLEDKPSLPIIIRIFAYQHFTVAYAIFQLSTDEPPAQ